jgi:hypothetical protein
MSLTAKESGSTFQKVAPGAYPARCFRLIDIGTQRGEWAGKPTVRHQCIISWELPNELIETGEYAGKPYSVSKFYTISLNEKANLRKDLESWRGREFTKEELDGFDLKNILGKPCMVSVIHEKDKVKVSGVMAMPKGLKLPEQINPSFWFDISDFDFEKFEALSDGIKAMIQKSDEYKMLHGEPISGSGDDAESSVDTGNDVPF